MKSFTLKELYVIRHTFTDLCKECGPKELNDIIEQFCRDIDAAEGYPVPNGDIYANAKSVLIDAIKNLNKEIQFANDIGLNVRINSMPTGIAHAAAPAMPPGLPPGYIPMPQPAPQAPSNKPQQLETVQFSLGKIYKEF